MAGPKPASPGRVRQRDLFVGGMRGQLPAVPVDVEQLQAAAKSAMAPEGYAYMAGGAGTESTIRENRAAFERWRLVPRMMRDVSDRDLAVHIHGQTQPVPFLLAPIGVLDLAHKDADLAAGRAAASRGVPFVVSNQASVPMEDVAQAMGDGARWFQLYWSRSNELVESLVGRAEKAGFRAIVVTLDTTMLGWRARDLDLAYLPFLRGRGIANYVSDPVFMDLVRNQPQSAEMDSAGLPNLAALKNVVELYQSYPGASLKLLRSGEALAAVRKFIEIYSRPNLTWSDLAWLRDRTRLPIWIKGILHPDDARAAVDHGVDGIVVSNHGGRQVDGAIATLDALPQVAQAVQSRVPILMDSGIRTGSDVLKAMALGAKGVLLGRPYAYGLAVAGEDGVREVIDNLRADLDLTLGLSGLTSVRDVDRTCIQRIEA